MKISEFKFGDIIKNKYASDDDPFLYGYLLKIIERHDGPNPGIYFDLTDGNGYFWEIEISAVDFLDEEQIKGK